MGKEPTQAAISADMLRNACVEKNPYLAIAIQYPADNGEIGDDEESVSVVRDTASEDYMDDILARLTLARHGQVGATYGLAYDWKRNQLYSGAYHLIQRPYGPGGVGAIYRTDLETGRTGVFARLDAGANKHRPHGGLYDYESAQWVGKSSLGDIDFNGDASELFIVNLSSRAIDVLSVPDGEFLRSIANGAASESWAGDARPMGLGYRDGWLYHGVVDSRELAQVGTPKGRVYRSRDDGSEMTLVSEFSFDYEHEPPWSAWHRVLDARTSAQPVISDIDFRPNGDLVVGIRNRVIDMHEVIVAGGDLLVARPDGSPAVWYDVSTDFYQDGPFRRDGVIGGLAVFGPSDWVVASGLAYWPGGGKTPNTKDAFESDAVWWFDNNDGAIRGPNNGAEWLMSDFSGEGDIELLCPPAVASTPTSISAPSASATATETVTPIPSGKRSRPAAAGLNRRVARGHK
ncbi:MAG: hypothetical protein U0470_03085 [Anaerolineae bacterium]